MNKKYELVNFNSESGLYQIKALYDFGDVKAGDLGGWVAGEHNLSHHGNCWIYDNGHVYGDGRVHGNACIYENAKVYYSGHVYDNATVYGNATVHGYGQAYGSSEIYDNGCVCGNGEVSDYGKVFGNGKVSGYGQVYGNGRVFGDAHVYGYGSRVFGNAYVGSTAVIAQTKDLMIFSNVGSENGILTLYKTVDGFGANRGCFTGTIEEFLKAVEEKHGDSTYAKQYRKMVEIFMMNFD